MRDDVARYQALLEDYASLGYAQLFVRTGDFHRAQGELEEALVGAYPFFQKNIIASPSAKQRFVKETAARHNLNGKHADADVESSFSRSPKLRAVEEAKSLIRAFSNEEQIAVVLLYVEERPEARVMEWLNLDPVELEDLRGRLREVLESWKPEGKGDDTAAEFFERAMRQYRLSPQFVPTVLGRVGVGAVSSGAFTRGIGWILLVGVPALIFLLWITNNDPEYRYGRLELFVQYSFSELSLYYSLFFAVASILLAQFVRNHTPPEIAKGLPGRVALVLRVCGILGALFCAMTTIIIVEPELLQNGNAEFLYGYAALFTAWRYGILILFLITAYFAFVPALKRLYRAPKKKEAASE